MFGHDSRPRENAGIPRGAGDRMMVMSWSRISLLTSGAAAAVLLASPASAQIGRGDAPVEVKSNNFEYLQNEGRGVYTGSVVATQADSRITTDKLTVICTKSKPAPGSQAEATCEAMEQL